MLYIALIAIAVGIALSKVFEYNAVMDALNLEEE
jgi:hypothetical protein